MFFGPKSLQVPAEIARLAEIFKHENVRSFLEIGSKFGGSLWALTHALPSGVKIVSVDLPGGVGWKKKKSWLRQCQTNLSHRGHSVELIWGDSHDGETYARVYKHAPFDAVFIDGDHSSDGVRRDVVMYGMMSRIVALHDVADGSFGVKDYWRGLRATHQGRVEEIMLSPTGGNNGIGVLWR